MKNKILITAVAAGGGHITSMKVLKQALMDFGSRDYVVETFISPQQKIDNIHRIFYLYLPTVYKVLYYLSTTQVFQIGKQLIAKALPFMGSALEKELKPFMLDPDIKVIVSTQFMLTDALLSLKSKYNSDKKIIVYVPDFDKSSVHFPKINGITADGLIAQNPELLMKIQKRHGIKHLNQAGYKALPEFSNVEKKMSKKFTLVVGGGSGWSSKVYGTVQKIVGSADRNNWNIKILIICGLNKSALKKYTELAKSYSEMEFEIYSFLNQKELAEIYSQANATLLAGLAPATLYELMEVNAAPIIVNYINPGQEKYNLDFAQNNNLVKYIPNKNEAVMYIKNLIDDTNYYKTEKQQFLKSSTFEKQKALERLKESVKFIETLMV